MSEPMMNPWMTTKEVCEYRRCHRVTLFRMRIPWCDKRVVGKIRYRLMVIGTKLLPRYFRSDVEAAYNPGEVPLRVVNA